jgi:replication-associated recombination protein RarA
MINLSEKYRPGRLADIIGQPKAVKVIRRFMSGDPEDLGGRSYWFNGPSGTGKTTLARIMADSFSHNLHQTELTGRELTILFLKDWLYKCHYYPMAGYGYTLLVNESHGLSRPVIECLLNAIESLPKRGLIIFTTTNLGDDLFEEHIDSSPFKSRCVVISLTSQGLCKPFAAHLKRIAEIEGLDGADLSAYESLVKVNRNNLRACLMEIEAGRMLITT